MNSEIPPLARKQVETIAKGLLHTIISQVHQRVTSTEWHEVDENTFFEALNELPVQESNARDLYMETQVQTIDASSHAKDFSADLSGESARFRVEFQCCHVLHAEAQALTQEMIETLWCWRNEHGLEAAPVLPEHPLGAAYPSSAREVDVLTSQEDGTQVHIWRFRHELLEVFLPVIRQRES